MDVSHVENYMPKDKEFDHKLKGLEQKMFKDADKERREIKTL